MGVFLQVAILPAADVSTVRETVEQAVQKQSIDLDIEACQYAQNVAGVQVLLAGALGFEDLAERLSRICCAPVMLLYLYDSDFWGYDYFFYGRDIDHFSSRPDYFRVEEGQWERLAGNPNALVGDFPIRGPEAVYRYFPSALGSKPREADFAYPGDQYPYGDCWQMTDFMARLGFPWAFDTKGVGGPSGPSFQPTLREILVGKLPPQPAEKSIWGESVFPLAGNLPTALDRDYIQEILQQEGFEKYAQKTPREIIENREEAKLAFGCEYVERRLCILSAFSAFWLGSPINAFWELYEAVGEGTDNIKLLRARGMAVPLFSKRHIAIKDLSRLVELDPANQDAYLLCRAFFYGMWGQKVENSRTDLAALAQLGTLRQDDPRLNFSAFAPQFLRDPERFFRREKEQDCQRLKAMTEEFDKEKRLREEKETRRLQLILEKRRKKQSVKYTIKKRD